MIAAISKGIRRQPTAGLLALCFALLLAGCRSQPVIYNSEGTPLAGLPTLAPTLTPLPSSTPTIPVIQLPTGQPAIGGPETPTGPLPGTPIDVDSLPYQTATPDPQATAILAQLTGTPASLDFGTETAVPTLAWRPPPMQVPVSIRPEDHFWFERPIGSDAVSWPHPYYRYGNTYWGYMSVHAGVDLDADVGTPVLAAGPGTVVWAGYGLYGINPPEDDPYGLAVAIKHDFGYDGQDLFTIYAHMSYVDVLPGQPVEAGEILGLSGNTGNSSGPHLHFEVRVGENNYRNTRNPELWLAPPTGWGVLAGRLLDSRGRLIDNYEMEVRSDWGQYFLMWTYGTVTANADDVYRENFVLSDLPAGRYHISTWIGDERLEAVVDIRAGQTSFVIMQAGFGDKVFLETSPQATHGPAPTLIGGATRAPIPSATHPLTPTPIPTATPEAGE